MMDSSQMPDVSEVAKPTPSRKPKKFIVEWRGVGENALFKNWTYFNRYSTNKSAQKSVSDRNEKDAGRWEYRIYK